MVNGHKCCFQGPERLYKVFKQEWSVQQCLSVAVSFSPGRAQCHSTGEQACFLPETGNSKVTKFLRYSVCYTPPYFYFRLFFFRWPISVFTECGFQLPVCISPILDPELLLLLSDDVVDSAFPWETQTMLNNSAWTQMETETEILSAQPVAMRRKRVRQQQAESKTRLTIKIIPRTVKLFICSAAIESFGLFTSLTLGNITPIHKMSDLSCCKWRFLFYSKLKYKR